MLRCEEKVFYESERGEKSQRRKSKNMVMVFILGSAVQELKS